MPEKSAPTEIWRIPKVLDITGQKRTAWYEAMRRGEAPKPVSLGPKAVGWIRHEIEEYIQSRILERDSKTAMDSNPAKFPQCKN